MELDKQNNQSLSLKFLEANISSEFEVKLLQVTRTGDISKVRELFDNQHWNYQSNAKTSITNITMIDAVIRNDYQMLKFLKNYCPELDEQAIKIIQNEAEKTGELKQYYQSLRKAGIYKLFKKEQKALEDKEVQEPSKSNIEDEIVVDEITNELDIDKIPKDLKQVLKLIHDAGYNKSFIAGLGLANIHLNNPNINDFNLYINADGYEQAKNKKFSLPFLKKENFSDKLLRILSKEGVLVNFVEIIDGKHSSFTSSKYKIALNNGDLKININLMGKNREHEISDVLRILNYKHAIAYDGKKITTTKDYDDNIRVLISRARFKKEVAELKNTLTKRGLIGRKRPFAQSLFLPVEKRNRKKTFYSREESKSEKVYRLKKRGFFK